MRILVTGGAGFLGSHLCERLLREGHSVVAVDNLFTGMRANLAGQAFTSRRFEFVRGDVCDERLHVEADQIYHLACPASPIHYQRNPVRTIETCVVGTLNMLRLAHQMQARFLLASTSEVYGDPLVHPQTESYLGNVNTIGPRACYDEGKRCAEALASSFARQGGVDIRIARIFNTYGPRMRADDGRVVSNFIVQALRGEPLTLFGDGLQTRSFCYVDDLIEGLVELMKSNCSEPVNLGNPDEFTVAQLAHFIKAMTGSASSIVQRELPRDDPRQRRPDTSRAWQLLGWAPKVRLRDGLQRTVDFFRAELNDAPTTS